MTLDRALTESPSRLSDAELDAALSLLGEAKRQIRLVSNLRPMFTLAEVNGFPPSRATEDNHKLLVTAVAPYNAVIHLIVMEMMDRQAERARPKRG